MFKESPEGTTHYQNDGCGEPAHNSMPLKQFLTTEREEFEKKYRAFVEGESCMMGYDVEEDLKNGVLPLLEAHDSKLLTVLKEIIEGMSVEKYPENGKDLKNHDFYLGYDKALSDILSKLNELT